MKRQSIAEQTLTKQLHSLATQETVIIAELEKLHVKLHTIRTLMGGMEAEISHLKSAREAASASRKP